MIVQQATVEPSEGPDNSSLQEIEARPAPETFLGIALLDLKPKHCRYPRGEGAAILFCGQARDGESSYCADCRRRCHQRGGYILNISDAERERRRLQAMKNNAARAA